MNEMKTSYYDILEVDSQATFNELREAYLKVLRKYDPSITGITACLK